ncbi:choice-of-anchor A family protein [Hyalangium minutum]|uniref:Choice-of-anchor A domain-containing protein n=1 Tax=Hyalangium minutum TaxID=394096 RepID=A0A085WXU4_9BACT|nr:choice-of-anchor A family protein [Hyalangium minutum]KFE72507.1 hypothetical protein DB31_0770 [Hyalangium minutum]
MRTSFKKNWNPAKTFGLLGVSLLMACGELSSEESTSKGAAQSASVSAEAAPQLSPEPTPEPSPEPSCLNVNLDDYNLFVLGNYSGGHDVVGKVAVGGNMSMTDFAVGSGLETSDTVNTLVVGGNLSLSRGAVFGDVHYGGALTVDPSVTLPRGSAAQGSPIDFVARGQQLRQLSSQLGAMPANGTTRRENWGGIFLRGTSATTNVVDLNASALTGAKLLSIEAPANSFVVVNIRGASATFTGFGIQFSGGINQHGVLFNFVDTTRVDAQGFGFWGTVLAPQAHVAFSNGSFDGGIYAASFEGNAEGHINRLDDQTLCPPPTPQCVRVSLNDYNLFLLGNYTGGHDVVGKVAVGGNMSMTDFAVGSGLETSDTVNTLVVGGNLSLSRGAVFGDVHYGGALTIDPSVTLPRGSAAQGSPIDFAARGQQLRQLSSQLGAMPANGTTRRENWGGIFLRGTSATTNVVDVDASALTGAKLLSIEAPADSLVVVNIRGASATFTGFGIQFGGGINQHGVLFNFVDTTRVDAQGFGFWGTVLAPQAHVAFSNGSFDGGIYAVSFEGNAEGHINLLNEKTACR